MFRRVSNDLKEAAEALTMDEKLAAVARCCRKLHVFHTFPDANGRTIGFLLCNLLLYQIGSSMKFSNPFFLGGIKTIKELVTIFKEEQQLFEKTKIASLVADYAEIENDRERQTLVNEIFPHLA